MRRRPLVYAHRGARAEEPENTLRAFRRAGAEGAEGVELDVRLSADGQLVVIHDATVDRTTDGNGKVADLSLAELRALDAGKGERIPTLDEALEACPGLLQIEIKAAETVAVMAARGLPSRAVLTSFHPEHLEEAARLLPHQERGLISHQAGQELLGGARDLGATWVCPELGEGLSAAWVARAQAAGIRVDAWPAADAGSLAACLALGADAVTTDYPAHIDAWLEL